MYNQLTLEHSLYIIDQNTFQLFLKEVQQYPMDGYVSRAISLNAVNNFAIVLQIWCLLNEDDLKLGLDYNKLMPYSIDHYILNLLRSNRKIKQFIQSRTPSHAMKYILSYHLACATLQWGDALILNHHLDQRLLQANQSRDYFVFSEAENLSHAQNHPFYHLQKSIIHLMASDYQKNHHLNDLIAKALVHTRQYLFKLKY